METSEKVLKVFFIVVAILLLSFMYSNIGQAPFWSYVKLIIGTGAFYFLVMILYNIYKGKKWNSNLFRIFK